MSKDHSSHAKLGLSPVQALTRFPGLAPAELPVAPVEPTSQATAAERWAVPIGPYRLLVNPAVGCELSDWLDVWPIPNTPRWISGVINLRGNLVPVFNLRQLFEQRADWPPPSTKLLFIVGAGENAGAIITDGLPYRQQLSTQAPTQLPDDLPQSLALRLYAAYQQQDTYWLDCDLPGLLSDLGSRADATSGGLGA